MPIFYSPELTNTSKKIQIAGIEYNHLKNTLRKREGDEMSLTNGRGIHAQCSITDISHNEITIQVNRISFQEKTKPHISLAFSLLKKNNELIIEKCTELGIYDFFPFISERTVKKSASSHQLDRLRKIAISAMKQCDSVYLPEIHNPIQFNELLEFFINKYDLILAWEEEQKTSFSTALEISKKDMCLVVGPEGGFEKSEVELGQKFGAHIVSLGNHILRAETAAITICAQVIFYQLQQNPSYY